LQVDRGLEVRRTAEVRQLPGIVETRRNGRIGADLADVSGDALAQRQRHLGRPEKSDQPVEQKVRIAGLGDRRHIGQDRRANAVGHREQLDLAGLQLRPHDGVGGLVDLDAPGGEIVRCLDLVAIRDLRQREPGVAQEPGDEKVDGARGAGPVELAGLRTRHRDEISEGLHRQFRGRIQAFVATRFFLG